MGYRFEMCLLYTPYIKYIIITLKYAPDSTIRILFLEFTYLSHKHAELKYVLMWKFHPHWQDSQSWKPVGMLLERKYNYWPQSD